MSIVAQESWRVLKPGGKCAILIGDARKHKRVVPIGFQTIRVFTDAGFKLRELVIKRQHNCKTTGFWYNRSVQYNFLLLAHEYLPIFEKPTEHHKVAAPHAQWGRGLPYRVAASHVLQDEGRNDLETTTVWIFPPDRLEAEIRRNLQRRFSAPESGAVELSFLEGNSAAQGTGWNQNTSLVYVHFAECLTDEQALTEYRLSIRNAAKLAARLLRKGSTLALETRDVRIGETFCPLGLWLYEDMTRCQGFALREIVIVLPEGVAKSRSDQHLEIVHRYLLIYTRQ